jgi:hypothetical protein
VISVQLLRLHKVISKLGGESGFSDEESDDAIITAV